MKKGIALFVAGVLTLGAVLAKGPQAPGRPMVPPGQAKKVVHPATVPAQPHPGLKQPATPAKPGVGHAERKHFRKHPRHHKHHKMGATPAKPLHPGAQPATPPKR